MQHPWQYSVRSTKRTQPRRRLAASVFNFHCPGHARSRQLPSIMLSQGAKLVLPFNRPGPHGRTSADAILQHLSERQFVRPHATLKDVLTRFVVEAQLPLDAAERAIAWLELAGDRAIGRLRRSELAQLSCCLERFAEQSLS